MMRGMPPLVPPVVPPGSLNRCAQPVLPLDGGLLLRPWLDTDAADVARVFRDPAIRRWHLRGADSDQEAGEWIVRCRRDWTDEKAAHWAVAGADGGLLGRVSLQSLVLYGGQAEIAYWTAPEARGRGVCSRAVARASHWALHEAGFHRIELGHSTANPASCRIADKNGYALEGTRRSALLHADGWHDMHLHSRVREAD
ncbi:RimJ/RimL family protein N-acetyltransferase [Kitasatospora cineracea]|uniref:RimJ/RimL family protein N-acetyltransferase n=2 Tax=Kitasatospora cineracea TaxID=88074 RepID=A0A3N4RUK7_9ACTN|nr:RimJ/RimL family protein N-acetyltransferase [Kitasatospora cineracea]